MTSFILIILFVLGFYDKSLAHIYGTQHDQIIQNGTSYIDIIILEYMYAV